MRYTGSNLVSISVFIMLTCSIRTGGKHNSRAGAGEDVPELTDIVHIKPLTADTTVDILHMANGGGRVCHC